MSKKKTTKENKKRKGVGHIIYSHPSEPSFIIFGKQSLVFFFVMIE